MRVTLHLKSGEEVPVMVDTGSDGTMLDKSLNVKLGKRLGKETYRFPAVKKGTAEVYASPELYLDGTKVRTGKNVSTIDWKGGAGILGMDCLSHYCIQLDFIARKLRFLDPDHLKTEELGTAFPITISPWTGHVHIRERFIGGKRAKWMIDTGTNVDGVLKRSAFRNVLRNDRVLVAQGEINGARGWGVGIPEAALRGQIYTNLVFLEMPANIPRLGFSNVIGLQFLARHLVTFNFPKRVMYLKRISVGPLAGPGISNATKPGAHNVGASIPQGCQDPVGEERVPITSGRLEF